MICDYDFHPPDDLRLFPMPSAGVLRFDDEVFVAQVRYGDVVVRHHAWRDRWFKINCTTDLRGRFIETTAPDDVPPFTFNCDIATPMVRCGDRVFAVPSVPTDVAEAPPAERVDLSETTLLLPGARASW